MIAQLLVPSPKQPPLHPPPPSPATTTTLQHPARLRRHHRTLPPTPLIRRDDFSAPTTSDHSTHFAAFAPPTWFNYLSTFLVRLRWCCCCCCCCVVNWCLCPVYRGLPNSIGSAHHIITKQEFNTFNIMAKSSIILALFCAFHSLYNVVAGTNAEGEKV